MERKITMTPIDTLIPYARNARTHSDAQVAQIAASLKEFGFVNPVLVDGSGGIIAGHGRVLAARKLGLSEVPCLLVDHLTDTQRRAYILADNKLALNAGWDDEMLRVELDELRVEGADLGMIGFDAKELAPIARPDGDKAGASPWDRVGPASEGIMFSFGEIQRRVPAELHDALRARIADSDIERWLREALSA